MHNEKRARARHLQVLAKAGLTESLSPRVMRITRDGYDALAALQEGPQCVDCFRKA